MGRGRRENLQSSIRKLLGVILKYSVLIVLMVSCLYTYVKHNQTIHFRYVQFIMCYLKIKKDAKKYDENFNRKEKNWDIK